MKIIILGTAHPFRGGGISTFNETMAAELAKRGHAVLIYTFTLQYPSFLFPGKSQYSDEPGPDNLFICRKVNSINPLNWLSVGREIARLNVDLMIVRFWLPFMAPCLGTISRIVAKNVRTKVIAVVDNMLPHEKRLGDRFLSRYFTNSVDGFLAMSKTVLSDISKFDKHKPKVLTTHPLYNNFGNPIGKPEARKQLNLPQQDRLILFFGFIPFAGDG